MENRINGLSDDLLLRILLLVPIKEAVTTTVLSKRWRFVWTMLPRLDFKDDGSESFGWFIEQSLQLHKAPILAMLIVELGPRCTIDIDIRKWVENAVSRGLSLLDFRLLWIAEPTSFPQSLYTCHTLAHLTLSNEIIVDVSSPGSLPSLRCLCLRHVVYKDEDSLVRLLSSAPVLKILVVERHEDDNLKTFTVKVPSLKTLYYVATWRNDHGEVEEDDRNGLLVVDAPALVTMDLKDDLDDYCLLENMPCLDVACITFVPKPHDKFLKCVSSVKYLYLSLTTPMVVKCCNNVIKFSWLIEFYFIPQESVDWLEPLIFLLQNSPKLKTLMIKTDPTCLQPSWNQPSSIPECLSFQLEMFGWRDYGGREDEKQLVTYILANSKSLKTAEISFITTSNLEEATPDVEEKQRELECLPRISTSSQLLFPTQVEWRLRR